MYQKKLILQIKVWAKKVYIFSKINIEFFFPNHIMLASNSREKYKSFVFKARNQSTFFIQ
ncbi:hypothetical protein CSB09_02480 [Candidatus Gracilibacteria bacterium]|nr:MAG: hypothetical protein CSB09_02480 [Candidatus Gracilibacteria bacterium]